jgi:hypothetical protein
MLTALLLVHAAALAGVLLLARNDVRLVDDNGRPLPRNGAWREQRVPAQPEEVPVP